VTVIANIVALYTDDTDKSLFLPLDTNKIGVKYEQREIWWPTVSLR
jgi:hypothetical protein